jgi:hypothetical protein
MGESRWRRHALVGLVALAVIVGVIGWYHYLTRPPRAVEIATSPAPPESTAQQPSPPAPQAPARPPATVPGPLTLSAKELDVTLRAEGALPHPSLGRYTGREVVWTGTVSAAGPVNDLLRVELKDPDGIRQLQVWNKIDVAGGSRGLAPGAERDEYGRISRVFVSARTGAGLGDLRGAICEMARGRAVAAPAPEAISI